MYYTTIYVYFIFLIMLLAHVILHKIRVEYVCISLLHNIIAWKARSFQFHSLRLQINISNILLRLRSIIPLQDNAISIPLSLHSSSEMHPLIGIPLSASPRASPLQWDSSLCWFLVPEYECCVLGKSLKVAEGVSHRAVLWAGSQVSCA